MISAHLKTDDVSFENPRFKNVNDSRKFTKLDFTFKMIIDKLNSSKKQSDEDII